MNKEQAKEILTNMNSNIFFEELAKIDSSFCNDSEILSAFVTFVGKSQEEIIQEFNANVNDNLKNWINDNKIKSDFLDKSQELFLNDEITLSVCGKIIEHKYWFIKSTGQDTLKTCYVQGYNAEKDFQRALDWLIKSAEQGYSNAQFELGKYYLQINTENDVIDTTKAVEWLKKAAESNHAGAQYILGDCYEQGCGIDADFQKALDLFIKAAENHDAYAQYNLYVRYAHGYGVNEDFQVALNWLVKSAEQGYPDAQLDLGKYYLQIDKIEPDKIGGNIITRNAIIDSIKGVEWLKKAAENHNAYSQYYLYVCYVQGYGVDENFQEALDWLVKSAEQGFNISQYELSRRYCMGKGVKKDYQKAVYWCKKLAEQGFDIAQYELAEWYYKGKVVEKDYKKSVYWYTKAAEQGHEFAQESLAFCYSRGKGVEKNNKKALYWLQMSKQTKQKNKKK